jgi:hypothetical protein
MPAAYRAKIALARARRLIFSAHVRRMMRKHVFGLSVGFRSAIFAGAIFLGAGVAPVRAQSGDTVSPPATVSPDHIRKPTEPPPFDANKPPARTARAKAAPPAAPALEREADQPKATRSVPSVTPQTTEATPRATSPQPATPNTPPAGAARPHRPATTIDPWAEPSPKPAPESRATTRRHAEPAKVIGIDSSGRRSDDPSLESSHAARAQRGTGATADTAPTGTTDSAR